MTEAPAESVETTGFIPRPTPRASFMSRINSLTGTVALSPPCRSIPQRRNLPRAFFHNGRITAKPSKAVLLCKLLGQTANQEWRCHERGFIADSKDH